MADLQPIFATLDHLDHAELVEVNAYITQLQTQPSLTDDPEEKIALLMQALAEFREGLSDADLHAIAESMNVEYSYPMKDLMRRVNWRASS
jgi:hypothetical protein